MFIARSENEASCTTGQGVAGERRETQSLSRPQRVILYALHTTKPLVAKIRFVLRMQATAAENAARERERAKRRIEERRVCFVYAQRESTLLKSADIMCAGCCKNEERSTCCTTITIRGRETTTLAGKMRRVRHRQDCVTTMCSAVIQSLPCCLASRFRRKKHAANSAAAASNAASTRQHSMPEISSDSECSEERTVPPHLPTPGITVDISSDSEDESETHAAQSHPGVPKASFGADSSSRPARYTPFGDTDEGGSSNHVRHAQFQSVLASEFSELTPFFLLYPDISRPTCIYNKKAPFTGRGRQQSIAIAGGTCRRIGVRARCGVAGAFVRVNYTVTSIMYMSPGGSRRDVPFCHRNDNRVPRTST